jgi:PIN domain nuclease of toxin-antitoxin system
MAAVVADTHAVIWYLLDQQTLSHEANAAIEQTVKAGDPIYLSTISLIEITYLVEKGRLPLKALEQLNKALDLPAAALVCVPITLDISRTLAQISRAAVPDMPDRIIAATALHLGLRLITRDHKIQTSQIETIW